MPRRFKNVRRKVFKDITDYQHEEIKKIKKRPSNFVTPNHMDTKENRKLNEELGLRGINKKNK